MANAFILPLAETQFVDTNGEPLAAGSVYMYVPGTTTFKSTWQDAAQTIQNSNPIILDAAGRAIILGSGQYRQVVYDAANNLIWDQVTGYSPSTVNTSGRAIPTVTGGLIQGGLVSVPASGSIVVNFPVPFGQWPDMISAVYAAGSATTVSVAVDVLSMSSLQISVCNSSTGAPLTFAAAVYWMAAGSA